MTTYATNRVRSCWRRVVDVFEQRVARAMAKLEASRSAQA